MEGKRGRKGQEREGGVRWNIDAVTMYVLAYLSRNIRTFSHVAINKHVMYYSYQTHTHTHTLFFFFWTCHQ